MFIPEKNILLNGFVLSLSAPFHANNILLLVTHLLSKSNDPMPFRVIIIISINFSIKRTFHLTFDKIGYYILFKTFKPIVFWFFSIHCWINFSFILSCIFFCLSSADIFSCIVSHILLSFPCFLWAYSEIDFFSF